MTVHLRSPMKRALSDAQLSSWAGIPVAIVSDELQRFAAMHAGIVPISSAERFVGEALTIKTMVGDNLALHFAVNSAPPGSVLLIDAGGFTGTAVWGEILHTVAIARGVAAVVVDGAIRDRSSLRDSPIPVFARGSTANGPHKGWGGSINDDIQCGGIKISAHDLVIGDADGVAVVPRTAIDGLLERCAARMRSESQMLERIRAGASTIDLLGFDPAALVSNV